MKSKTLLRKLAKEALGVLPNWSKDCHRASLQLVRHGLADRVARGTCRGIGGQHSWAVVGMDCYDETATIIDPTIWSYRKDIRGIWIGTLRDGLHVPHGKGLIWNWGRPPSATDKAVSLTPKKRLSKQAVIFLNTLGPLDWRGWAMLASAPVQGWPAEEILAAMHDTKDLRALVPIDILGMLTDRNPGGLYLRE